MKIKSILVISVLAVVIVVVLLLGGLHLITSSEPTEKERDYEVDSIEEEVDPVVARLMSLGYLEYAKEYKADNNEPIEYGVTKKTSEAYPGLNLFSLFGTGKIYLMNMGGEIIHTWNISNRGRWEYFNLLDDGSLIGIYNSNRGMTTINKRNSSSYLVKLDWDSNIIWKKEGPFHHDLSVAENGDIYTLTFHLQKNIKAKNKEITLADNQLVRLDSNGNPIQEISFYDLFWDQVLQHKKKFKSKGINDVFHGNTAELVERDTKVAKIGDVLICPRNMNIIAIVDLKNKMLKWHWGRGELQKPHKPTLMENGNILVFDNGAKRKHSRILEVDPTNNTIVWEYVADPKKSFYSEARGSAQKLPNGNVVVCESDRSRLFEVNQDKEIVWDYTLPKNEKGKRPVIIRLIKITPQELEEMNIPQEIKDQA